MALRSGQAVFVDTGAWIALALTRDPLHERAVAAWADLASVGAALRTAFRGITGLEDAASLPRTEQGITGRALAGLMIMSLALSAVVYYAMTGSVATTVITAMTMFVLAFFFVAVASYIVGLVGSSNSPVSGMTICTVLITAGPPLYLPQLGAERAAIARRNLLRLVTHVPQVIVDHHLLRGGGISAFLTEARAEARRRGHRLQTAAESLGQEENPLESRRRALWGISGR